MKPYFVEVRNGRRNLEDTCRLKLAQFRLVYLDDIGGLTHRSEFSDNTIHRERAIPLSP